MAQDDLKRTPAPAPVTGYAQALAGPLGPLPGLPASPRPGMPPATASAPAASAPAQGTTAPKPAATETLARRAGALVNEIDFPKFVAQLVHGTFDAVVDASIRQMETYSDLVAAAAKTVEQFTDENISPNQARDWLAQRHPGDVALTTPTTPAEPSTLQPRAEDLSPAWLADFGLAGETLTAELLETQLVPQVRSKIGSERHQLLATMVMLGMNRVAVRDGTVSAKVRFRAEAQDTANVHYATSSDPPAVGNWGERGSMTYGGVSTKVSTLDVNAQNDTSVRAELYGEVKLNFVSETLPLDRLVEPAKVAMLQRHSATRASAPQAAAPAASAPAAAPAAPGGGR